MYCSILNTVSQEEDSNLHIQWCQVCNVPFWSQYHKKIIPTYICRGVRYVLFHSDHSITRRGFQFTYAVVSGMYCSILITVSQEEDSNLHMQGCQVCTVPFWLQYQKKRIQLTYTGVSGMYCSILITVSLEGDSNLQMQWCQVCTVPFWSQYHKKRIPTYICRGVRYVLFHSDHSITRRGFQFTYAVVSGMYCSILITVSQEGDSNLHIQGCQVCTVPFWSQYHKKRILTYICSGVRYVLFHSDHSITRRGFQLTYSGVTGMYCSILITVSQEEDSNLHMQGCQVCTVPFWSQYHKKRIPTYICRGVRYVMFHSDHSITRRGF